MLNIGIRAHDMEKMSLEKLAKSIKKSGFHTTQLAIGKSYPELYTGYGCLSTGLANHIGKAFKENDISIAILGCYINMIHPDDIIRDKEINKFKEMLRYARDFGCSIVGTETGTLNLNGGYTLENYKEEPFLQAVESVKQLVSEAEKFGVIVGIEGGINHPVHDIYKMKRLLDLVNSNNLQVIFDPANFMTIDYAQNQAQFFQDAFTLFGHNITALHMKDFIIENKEIKIVPAGQGILDYEALFRVFKPAKPYIFSLLEGATKEHIKTAREHVMNAYEQVNMKC